MNTKRFTTEAQILAAIDKCKADAEAKLIKADGCDAEAKLQFKKACEMQEQSPGRAEAMRNRGKELLEEADRYRKSGTRLLETKAKKLGEKLSEFRTIPAFALTGQKGIGDESVKA